MLCERRKVRRLQRCRARTDWNFRFEFKNYSTVVWGGTQRRRVNVKVGAMKRHSAVGVEPVSARETGTVGSPRRRGPSCRLPADNDHD